MRSTFWNRVEVRWHDGRLKSASRLKEILAFFLDRTCGRPFSFVELDMSTVSDYFTFDVQPILLDLVVYSEQWENVFVQLRPSKLQYLCGAKGRLPMLKKLFLSVATQQDITLPSMVANIFKDAPLLTHIALWESPSCQFFKINWSSMTILEFRRWSTSLYTTGIAPILRETINLVELTIIPKLPDTEGGRLIHLPCLERLSIIDVKFLTILDTPFLQQLKIIFDPWKLGLNDKDIITTFLSRSGIRLSTLVIECGLAAVVIEILRFMPKIHKLVLDSIQDVEDVFKWLARTEAPLCSDLHILSAYSEVKKSFWALHDMIACRNPPGDEKDPSPQKVTIMLYGEGESTVLENLELLCRDRGVPFTFGEFEP